MDKFDFCGWATKNDLKCSDGRIIRKDAFKHHDGKTVPLVWNHDHNDPFRVIGKAVLQHRDEGVYAYGYFNDTELAKTARIYVEHGDITQMSIWANQLKQQGNNVMHGTIREVSLVLAGANPGACIENVIKHDGLESDDEARIWTGEDIELYHGEEQEDYTDTSDVREEEDLTHAEEAETKEETVEDVLATLNEKQAGVVYGVLGMLTGDDDDDVEHSDSEDDDALGHADGEESVKDILGTLNEKQSNVFYYLVAKVMETIESEDDEDDETEGGNGEMKHNAFENEQENTQKYVLSHADQEAIIELAKQSSVGSLKTAMNIFAEEKGLAHGDGVGVFEDYGVLFPELELLKKGEPETIWANDQNWVGPALRKIHKSPFSRIRTRHADARLAELKAKGYQNKGDQKTIMGQIKMINRETTPQTIYIKDNLHRDDILDITDFSIVDYQWKIMRTVLDETMVLAALIGDGREDDDPDKIHEDHVRPIWNDNDEYTIHCDVDIAAAKQELQGTDTSVHFGDNYVYAEAVITAALYSREKFKGTGTPDFYCTPHLVNVMLLARDLNGRRIYDSKSDLAKALNCNSIVEVEQLEGLTRTTEDGDTKKLLGLFVNLNDYTFGSTRGGEITKFEDFDMDFNLKKFMLETRLSGSLYKLKSAIALEEPVTATA